MEGSVDGASVGAAVIVIVGKLEATAIGALVGVAVSVGKLSLGFDDGVTDGGINSF